LQPNFLLDAFNTRSQDFSMPPPPANDPNKAIILATVSLTTLRPIEDAMNPTEKEKTGLTKLTAGELANLNEWLDGNAVLAPGNKPG
jgi:hypothetical protein